jgi:acyl-CoA thioesterase
MAGPFSEDVVVERVDEGRYTASVDHSWDTATLPQGGIVAAFGLRASAAEVGQPTTALRTCTTVFAGPVAAGDLEVEVTVLRSGRSAQQVLSTVRNAGAPSGATTLAVFGGSRRGPDFVDVTPPTVGRPDEYLSFADRPPPPPEFGSWPARPIWDRIDGKPAIGHAPWDEYVPTTSDVATWVRLVEPPVLEDGSLDPLAVPVLVDRMPGAVGERDANQTGQWFAPSIDLTVHFFRPAEPGWLLAHERARWAHDGWASAESMLWTEDGQLVAYATQMMVFAYE